MYIYVANTIAKAAQVMRDGDYFSASPYTTSYAGYNPGHAIIAVQKADVVAHSYGGLLTRWYMEQSGLYQSRRDVRKLITLGTPHKGSPLANMVDEIYRNPLFATSHAYGQFAARPTLADLLSLLDSHGLLPSALPGGSSPRPFYEDASVNSVVTLDLNATPFLDDAAYAAVVGTDATIYGPTILGKAIEFLIGAQLYNVIQPTDADGMSYFPWVSQFDPVTDGLVPDWSASLGVPNYNYRVDVNHISLPQNSDVQQKALQWLNDPNLPLGITQRASYDNKVPVSVRNAFQGASTTNAIGHLTGGGVNPNAIVDVTFPVTAAGLARWDTTPQSAGIKRPTLTGMIRLGDIGAADFIILGRAGDADSGKSYYVLQDLGQVLYKDLHLASSAVVGATLDDWVAFSVTKGTIGRRHDPMLTGPDGWTSASPRQTVAYIMSDLPGENHRSPGTPIDLPDFSLSAPAKNGLVLTLSGAAECASHNSPSNKVKVDLRAVGTFFDTTLATLYVNVAHPTGAWDGLLLPYSGIVGLVLDSNGYVVGPGGKTSSTSADVYQYLSDDYASVKVKSGTVRVP